MADKNSAAPVATNPSNSYEITIKGHLDEHWRDWFGNLEVSHDQNGCTVLSGFIVDQSALHGILAKFWSLNLTLVSVIHQEDG